MGSGFAASRRRGMTIARSRLDHDARGGAIRAARLAELGPDVLGDVAVDRGLRTIRLAHHQRPARIRGLADGEIERHFAQERHAEPFRLAPRAAVPEYVGALA